MTLDEARSTLDSHGQEHVLTFWPRLDQPARAALLAQIASLDFTEIAAMRAMLGKPPQGAAEGPMEPAEVTELVGESADAARYTGILALRDGHVGVVLVAGGQGSRLGYEGPKGCFPIGPVTNSSLFHLHARKVLALERRWQTKVPLYIMTSPMNEAPTRAFFEEHAFFGLNPERVKFFSQAMWPALSPDGKIILDAPGHIFMSPDGHGGTLSALDRSGCLADMRRRGLTTVFYFQVDNPLVDVADAAFIGHHLRNGADISLKVCAKRDPDEGLGVVVDRNGTTLIVEYSELSAAQKRETRPDGRLRFLYGSVAIHVFSVAFLSREAAAGLPLHIAHKKVPVCDAEGRTGTPSTPNAYKFEKFIFDALADARICACVAFDRAEEFSPVKNADGADSPATCRRDLSAKWARWLRSGGVPVALDAQGYAKHKVEIDPCYALDAQALHERLAKESPALNPDGDILLV